MPKAGRPFWAWVAAQAAKKLFEENICYTNGEPVKVVIADTTIGRVAETAAASPSRPRGCR